MRWAELPRQRAAMRHSHANDLAKGYLKNRRWFQPHARMRGGWRQFGETEKWFEAPMNDDVDLCGAEVFIL